MKVKLTYFKNSGKYYSDGEYNTSLENGYEIYGEVRSFQDIGILPGLSTGKWEGYILVAGDVVPALLDYHAND